MLAESLRPRHWLSFAGAVCAATAAATAVADRATPLPDREEYICVELARPTPVDVPVVAPPHDDARSPHRVVVATLLDAERVSALCAATNKPELTVAFADVVADSATMRVQVACSALAPAATLYRLELSAMVEDLDGKNDTLWHADRIGPVPVTPAPITVRFE